MKTLPLQFTAIYPGGPGLASTRMSPFLILLELTSAKYDGGGGDNWSYDMQSSSQIIITNKPAPIKLFYSYSRLSLFTNKSIT